MQKVLDRSLGCNVRPVCLRNQDETHVTVEVIDCDHIDRGAQRICFAECADRRGRFGCLNVAAHHLLDGEVAHPADLGGGADALATRMETPGWEGLAEPRAR